MKEIVGLIISGAFIFILIGGEMSSKSGKKQCQHCGSMISYSASTCPYCHRYPGTDVGAEAKSFGRLIKFFIKAIVLLVFVAIILNLIGIL